jgi:hypothetical protein
MRPRLVSLGAQVLAGCPRVPLRPVRPIGAAVPGPVGSIEACGSIGSIGRCTCAPRWSSFTPLTELARRAGGAPAGAWAAFASGPLLAGRLRLIGRVQRA